MTDIASLGVVVRPDGIQQTTQQLDGLTKAGATAEKQAAKIAPAMDKAAVSAKQLAFATRGLPAQFTDIATSLASGQNPLTVLLQQGGQIKDTFGGAVPALRAVGGYLAGLINPITLTAGAVAALGAAWLQAAGEGDAFNRALILTGNYANKTAEELSDMAAQLDDTTSATQGKAADVLAQVAETGRFTAEQINLVAEAAIRMEDATGQSIEDTIKQFVSLQGDPVEAILKLNEAQHFLTQETLDQIESLKEQGRQADASAVAVTAYADTINDRAPKVVEHLRLTSIAWRGVKNSAAETWDAIVNGFRRADEAAASSLETMKRYFSSFSFGGGPAGAAAAAFGTASAAAGAAPAPAKTVDTAQAKAALEFEKEGARFATQRQKMERDISEARALGLKAGKSEEEIEKRIAAIRASYASRAPKQRQTRERTDPAEGIISRIREQIAVNQAEQASVERLTVSERLRISVMEDLKKQGEKVTAARRAEIDALLAELDSSGKAAEAFEEEAKAKQNLVEITNELTAAEKNRAEANRIELESIGRGRDEVEQMRRRLDIEREYEDNVKRLNDRAASERRQVTEAEVQALKDSRDRMLKAEEDFQGKRVELLGDWKNGARAAIEDFAFEAADVASATYDIFRGAFDGLSNVITDFITKGKGDFEGFLDSLLADITSFIVKQQLSKWMESLFGGTSSGSGGALASLAGAFFGGGRAIGGPVSPGRLYEVTERGAPELLQMQGRQYLIPPARGQVTPMSSTGSDGAGSKTFNFNVNGSIDRRSASQIATEMDRKQRIATARNGA